MSETPNLETAPAPAVSVEEALEQKYCLPHYEPPLSDPVIIQGKAWHIGAKPLAKGVLGCAYENGDEIWIPLIVADKKGSGNVGRFLDSLSARCVVVDVVSPRLREMLVRRGWKQFVGTEHQCWRRK